MSERKNTIQASLARPVKRRKLRTFDNAGRTRRAFVIPVAIGRDVVDYLALWPGHFEALSREKVSLGLFQHPAPGVSAMLLYLFPPLKPT